MIAGAVVDGSLDGTVSFAFSPVKKEWRWDLSLADGGYYYQKKYHEVQGFIAAAQPDKLSRDFLGLERGQP